MYYKKPCSLRTIVDDSPNNIFKTYQVLIYNNQTET